MVTTVRWCSTVKFSQAVGPGGADELFLYLNDITDPYGVGSSRQPMYLDMYEAIYKKYRVLGAKMKAEFVNIDAAPIATQGFKVFSMITESDDHVYAGDNINYLLEHPRTGNGQNVLNGYADSQVSTIYRKFSPRTHVGRNYYDEDYAADIGAQPSKHVKWKLIVVPLDPGYSVMNNIRVNLTLDYLVEFSVMKDPSISAAGTSAVITAI